MHIETTFKFNIVHKRNIIIWVVQVMMRRKKREKKTSNNTETSIITLSLLLERSC
jgi:hypothetical protein